MLSESIHSAVDMGNELLLLYGMRRAERNRIMIIRSVMVAKCIFGALWWRS